MIYYLYKMIEHIILLVHNKHCKSCFKMGVNVLTTVVVAIVANKRLPFSLSSLASSFLETASAFTSVLLKLLVTFLTVFHASFHYIVQAACNNWYVFN